MEISDEEKKCLAIATDFLNASKAVIGLTETRRLSDIGKQSGSEMLANIATDKYRDCIKDAAKNQKARQPKR